ncbi:thermonuclease family protein [Candidatus Gottesmanbacteria bacterium]|nr:thermonuclease family protein [Candidatus Gottesmanbacteria bacterium]
MGMILTPRRWIERIGLVILGIIIALLSIQILRPAAHLAPAATVIPTLIISPALIEGKSMVTKVIDGDTIELATGQRVRYIGIDTPESVDPRKSVECFARQAAARNKELVLGKSVRLEKDVSQTDKYGRLLRYIYVNNQDGNELMVNDVLVREGYAFARSFPPDIKYQERFRQAEEQARRENKGLWASCPGQSPSPISSDCAIKGNISSSGKIYHLPNCGSYDKTAIDESAGERWFCTEEEAIQAGWRKAKNC